MGARLAWPQMSDGGSNDSGRDGQASTWDNWSEAGTEVGDAGRGADGLSSVGSGDGDSDGGYDSDTSFEVLMEGYSMACEALTAEELLNGPIRTFKEFEGTQLCAFYQLVPNLCDFVDGFMAQSVTGNPKGWNFLMTGNASFLNQLKFVMKEEEPGVVTAQEADEAYEDGHAEGHLKGESAGFCSGYKAGYADGFSAAREEAKAALKAEMAKAFAAAWVMAEAADLRGEAGKEIMVKEILTLSLASEEDLRAIDESAGASGSSAGTAAAMPPASTRPAASPSVASGAAVACPSWYEPGLESWLGLSKTKKKQLRSKQARLGAP